MIWVKLLETGVTLSIVGMNATEETSNSIISLLMHSFVIYLHSPDRREPQTRVPGHAEWIPLSDAPHSKLQSQYLPLPENLYQIRGDLVSS